jgi:phage shock protein A
MMKKDLGLLEGKVQEIKRQKETLSARKNSAQDQKSSTNSIQKFTVSSMKTDDLLGDLKLSSGLSHGTLEKEIDEIETETAVMRELMASKPTLEETFDNMERTDNIEKILNEIKAKSKTRRQ